jgi:hypothetical protein
LISATRTTTGDQIVLLGTLLDPGNNHHVGHSEGTLTAVSPDAGFTSLAFVVVGCLTA